MAMSLTCSLLALSLANCIIYVKAEESPIEVDSCKRADTCVCNVHNDWSAREEYGELQSLRSHLAVIKTRMGKLDVTYFHQSVKNLTGQLESLEHKVNTADLTFSLQELTAIRKEVSILANLLAVLNVTTASQDILEHVKEELGVLGDHLDELWQRSPETGSEALKTEIAALRSQLSKCQNQYGTSNTSFFPGDQMELKPNLIDWCSAHTLDGVAEAVTHRWNNAWTYGSWFKDPYPKSLTDRTKIFFRIHGHNQFFHYYNNYTDFITQKNPVSTHKGYVTGVGYVAYNGSLYFYHGNNIYRYNIEMKQITSNSLMSSGINYLKNTLATYVDFKVDEYGLWAIYTKSDNLDKLVISKINPGSLELEQTWLTNKRKSSVCATFMVCGVLYAIDTCTSRVSPGSHHQQYAYDTRTSQQGYVPFHVTSKYGHIWELMYNPREKMLFGWDMGHMVTYPLTWKTEGSLLK